MPIFFGVTAMLVRIVRRLTLNEIEERMRSFETEYGMTFDDFEEMLIRKGERVDPVSVEAYLRWADLVHAYRRYFEDGEIDCIVEEIMDLNPKEMGIFTPKRLELLYQLSALKVASINDLAHKLRRNVKNVYQDLKILHAYGFISFRKRGKKNKVPENLVEEITFLIG